MPAFVKQQPIKVKAVLEYLNRDLIPLLTSFGPEFERISKLGTDYAVRYELRRHPVVYQAEFELLQRLALLIERRDRRVCAIKDERAGLKQLGEKTKRGKERKPYTYQRVMPWDYE